jgi:hypothetical protein
VSIQGAVLYEISNSFIKSGRAGATIVSMYITVKPIVLRITNVDQLLSLRFIRMSVRYNKLQATTSNNIIANQQVIYIGISEIKENIYGKIVVFWDFFTAIHFANLSAGAPSKES